MAKVLLSQRSDIDENIFTRNDIGAFRQAQGRQAHFKLDAGSASVSIGNGHATGNIIDK
jgi:hypothetical protein